MRMYMTEGAPAMSPNEIEALRAVAYRMMGCPDPVGYARLIRIQEARDAETAEIWRRAMLAAETVATTCALLAEDAQSSGDTVGAEALRFRSAQHFSVLPASRRATMRDWFARHGVIVRRDGAVMAAPVNCH